MHCSKISLHIYKYNIYALCGVGGDDGEVIPSPCCLQSKREREVNVVVRRIYRGTRYAI